VDGIHALQKVSENIEKIKAEYDYYYNLPEHLQRYFVQPFHFEINDDKASYYIEQYNIEDMAKQLVENNITEQSFVKFIEKIKRFQWECKDVFVSDEEIYKESKSIILDKNVHRKFLLDNNSAWKNSEYKNKIAKNNITTESLFNRLSLAFEENYKNRKTNIVKISHGDLCFSNILWCEEKNLIRFIDVKGMPYFIMDEYYDIAKLSHSLLGRYDEIIYEKYEVDFEKNLLTFTNTGSDELYKIFIDYLNFKNIDYKLLRIFEASIFLSMCSNHIEDDKRVAVFLMNCNRILTEIGY
jgi:uncharacterized protein (UPF0335 family)